MDFTYTGIPSVGEVPYGTHFCQFYDTQDDLVDSLAPFFAAGLEANEACLWVTAAPFRAQEARSALRNAVPGLADREQKGQIVIYDHEEWYGMNPGRDAKGVLQDWVQYHDRALAQGYQGMRLTGNTYFLEREDWSAFVEYEALVNDTFRHHRILGLCSYCIDKAQTRDVFDIVRNHEFAIARRDGAWDVLESSSLAHAKQELCRLNEELEERVRQRTADLERLLQTRDDFISVAAHELKTPVTSLQLFVEGIRRGAKNEALSTADLQRRLDRVSAQCERLDKLVNSLLNITHLSHAGMVLKQERTELADLVRRVVADHAALANAVGCTVTVEDAAPVVGYWDQLRLEEVLTNLLSNAYKHAPQGPISVSIDTADGTAIVRVKDSGAGIPEADLDRIFEKFMQADCGGPENAGFGLGLWIVKMLVSAMNGTVSVQSRPGEGAEFCVELPLRP